MGGVEDRPPRRPWTGNRCSGLVGLHEDEARSGPGRRHPAFPRRPGLPAAPGDGKVRGPGSAPIGLPGLPATPSKVVRSAFPATGVTEPSLESEIFVTLDEGKAKNALGQVFVVGGVPYKATTVEIDHGKRWVVKGIPQDPWFRGRA